MRTASVAALVGDDVGDDSTMALVTYVTPGPDGDYAWRGRGQLVARFGATVVVLQKLDVQLVDSEPFFTDAEWQRIVDTASETRRCAQRRRHSMTLDRRGGNRCHLALHQQDGSDGQPGHGHPERQ